MESPDTDPVAGDDTFKDRYYGSMVQVKGDVAGLQFNIVSLEARLSKLEKILRLVLCVLLILIAIMIASGQHEQRA